ncbi:hypothetical protein PGTUg99_005961 [Puccinia graminis f. sp. tritici]|uniref:Uncharacterized protein n=1 Tax=Puccinia graminis f. sp. tritici TaxID=56615 RepID=A0A5B0RWH1_PUCGR|nr:hypothetical protein PGTUg99_005961 [Puccinia graminis f. sp. tritici]
MILDSLRWSQTISEYVMLPSSHDNRNMQSTEHTRVNGETLTMPENPSSYTPRPHVRPPSGGKILPSDR